MKMKQWFIGTVALSMVLLLAAGSFVVLSDPFFYYRWDADGEGVFYNQRYQDAGIARNSRADTVLLGTSMVSNFRASDVAAVYGGTAAKLTIPDGHFSEFSTVLDTVFANGAPQRVIFSLDTNILVRDDAGAPGLPDYLYDRNPLNDSKYLLNKDALFYGAYSLYMKATGQTVSADEAFTWDGDTGFSTAFVLASYERPESASATVPANAYLKNAEANCATVLFWAEEHPETEFIVYIPPYNILYWDKIRYSGETDAVFAALDYCFETLSAKGDNLHLYELLDHPICKDCSYYNDYIHFSGLGAKEVLASLTFDETVGYTGREDRAITSSREVTAETRGALLDNIRAFKDDFDYEALLAKK